MPDFSEQLRMVKKVKESAGEKYEQYLNKLKESIEESIESKKNTLHINLILIPLMANCYQYYKMKALV